MTLVFILISCQPEVKNTFTVDTNLEILDHRTDATTRELALHDFEIAEASEIFFDTIRVNKCHCNLESDTLNLSIGYRSEVIEIAEFKIFGNKYQSKTLMISDVPEYNGSDKMVIPTYKDRLTLNKSSFEVGDTLIGKFYLQSDTIRYNEWNKPIIFKGKFQCIVKNAERSM